MCGIYGSTIHYSDILITAKLNRINFRGPDYSSFERTGDVILGHNRLSIIDLDPRSNQPLSYNDLKIVFNGEIYNYKDIKNELSKKGYVFNTSSDTEVICAAYLEYGEKCVNHFNGMFSFVIYNKTTKVLFGARDRLGKKPFYYSKTSFGFEFASQPSQIAIGRNLTINQNAINAFLFWNYIPEPLCIYSEINKLPAGSYFTYNTINNEFKIEKYWDIDFTWTNKFTGSYNDAIDQLKILLDDAVKIRMNADVPLGIFLSSGIDSSLIAAIATKYHPKVNTFNVSFDKAGFDESTDSKAIASFLGTQHHTIECNYHEGINLIDSYTTYFDEPFADPSAIPGLLLAKHTKKHVTVALTGDGGDESFLGYHRYKWINSVKRVYDCPLVMRKAIAWFTKLSPNYRHKLIAMGLSQDSLIDLYIKLCGGMDNSWVKDEHKEIFYSNSNLLKNPDKPLLERVSDYDIKTYLNDDINTKVDRSSMAYAIESRAPLMDYRVVEFARSLPSSFKMNSKVQKRILKDILFQHIPSSMYDRPKSGFSVPFKDWFRNELKEYVMDNLNQENLSKIPGIKVPEVQKMINEHMSGKWNRFPIIWTLLVLGQWINSQKKSHQSYFKKQLV